jgi:hypothetical protein
MTDTNEDRLNKPVWLIEAKDGGEWYPCWYQVYYSKAESLDELDKLLLPGASNGFDMPRRNYRTKKYERALVV